MKEFEVQMTCTLTETLTVEADSLEEAMKKAEDMEVLVEHDISRSFTVDREETLGQNKEVEALRGDRLRKGSIRP